MIADVAPVSPEKGALATPAHALEQAYRHAEMMGGLGRIEEGVAGSRDPRPLVFVLFHDAAHCLRWLE
ncbi:hypothetical protein SAMN06295912_12133 [Sphingomonas laterariae]|uniref:Uncharacterized protein n=1 Tax=Edaphosphingomonas laterariae TaxID=861865 RepID=A0A239I3P8_9SPHN|nr:hypothetical protein SAMN06295912_12133 [Sphingomonas laterariae]